MVWCFTEHKPIGLHEGASGASVIRISTDLRVLEPCSVDIELAKEFACGQTKQFISVYIAITGEFSQHLILLYILGSISILPSYLRISIPIGYLIQIQLL